MQRCLQLAEMGAGHVAPNPMVGAVLVYDNRIIGEGYHRQYGGPHAEVNCISSVTEKDRRYITGSTLYVSLEPCAHFGKTPPCSDLIAENKIPRVIIGCRDSFDAVNGRGIEKLKAAGLDVTVGVLEKECIALNKRFFTLYEQKRPYVILKWAQSADGMIAGIDGERIFISNEFTNRLVHRWRSGEASILVGTKTALLDDPSLTARLWSGNDPVRLVIDRELKLPAHLKLFDRSVKTIVFNCLKQEENEFLRYYQLKKEAGLVPGILSALYELQLQSVIVEGGRTLLQSFIDAGAWDEARVISNGHLTIGKGIAAPVLKKETLVKEETMGSDTISYFERKKQ